MNLHEYGNKMHKYVASYKQTATTECQAQSMNEFRSVRISKWCINAELFDISSSLNVGRRCNANIRNVRVKYIVSNFSVRKQPALDISRAVLLELPRNRSGPVALLILISEFLHMDCKYFCSQFRQCTIYLCSTHHILSRLPNKRFSYIMKDRRISAVTSECCI
jgi:hypothetical protein